MSYTEILAAFEASELEAMSAFELADCHDEIELYELAADEAERLEHSGMAELRRYVA